MSTRTHKTKSVNVHQAGALDIQADDISTELPIALVYNGISHVVLMATPSDLAELALGFSLSEGILSHAQQLYDLQIKDAGTEGVIIEMQIASAAFQALKQKRRYLNGRTGCGLCGIESLQALATDVPRLQRQTDTLLDLRQLPQALAQFDQSLAIRTRTGSVHGVAYFDSQANLVASFEDVGRHNALDKLIGFAAQQPLALSQGFVLISSRASYEMVLKAVRAGIGTLVAISAPTSLAIDMAEKANLSLVGFARPHRQVIYCGAEYLSH
ncbi:formate dehydrogenase accessory sulfurtransferase FdhD [Brackiella oedipodis]|uniref:formate dehydrogenase accessory sulfurtransferase FdhD n=1 Tax=Brackiella oedipodis TaxID=124225 RepID=UPI00048CB26C|nr:formate dehydrogenase accessory sulfurtransferase FdhD [Brackiella oedipodis]